MCEFLPGYLRDEKERERLDLRVTTVDVRRGRLGADRERVRRMIQGEAYDPGRRVHPDRALAGGYLRHHGRHVDR